MNNSFKYKVYGLTLQSNRPIPGLIPAQANAPVDVWVDLIGESQPSSAEVESISSGIKVISRDDGNYLNLWFRGEGQLDFEINPQGDRIWATWTYSVLEQVSALLLGQVLGCTLRLRGTLCLHACVVRIGQQAIAIVGQSGAGKSTTAAALVKRGYSILSDDIAAINYSARDWLVQPGYPRLRLWPKSVNALYGSQDALDRIFSFSEKRFVDLTNNSESQFYNKPLPLAAIYVLGERQSEFTTPKIEPIPPMTAVMNLMTHRSVSHLKLAADKQAQEFAGLSSLAGKVPVRKVIRSDNLEALPQLCEAIVEDASNIITPEKCTQP
ncbi:serine kinase of the HPr protein, regulates carbohydrate metabolism [Rivularia sp. PCC 7116]|uniref:serine kinase of the HPr protein, regulates carbohydrate metabolism n=1 Tax=Rivularia sp. PCC 7116 TaxID=373994 RepID=UPI00029F2DD8|nr:serine kinase of the HPr protein, regulates carbohydrate metabolism [Rivularia sp. PCC 7116]AFY57883.1 serine kinase of the HPr protein, regulates carbohydrate metabolism [Rivularia sp. PCC 7116]